MAMAVNQGCGNSAQAGMISVIESLQAVKQLILQRANPQLVDQEESELFALASMILFVAERMILLEMTGTNPFVSMPSGATALDIGHWERLKNDFNVAINHIYTELVIESNRRASQIQPTNLARPGCVLNQPVTSLICPYCNTNIPASIDARVGSDSQGILPSVKVRVNFEGQPDEGLNQCPNCQQSTKTRLLIAADGQTSNSLTVTVALDQVNPSVGETLRMISECANILYDAREYFPVALQQQPLDNVTATLVSKCIQSTLLILLAVGDGTFKLSSWMAPNQNGQSVVDEVGDFFRDHFGFLNPVTSNP